MCKVNIINNTDEPQSYVEQLRDDTVKVHGHECAGIRKIEKSAIRPNKVKNVEMSARRNMKGEIDVVFTYSKK